MTSRGYAANQMRKVVTIAELLHAAGVTVEQARGASDETKAVCGEAARIILKTQKARPPSDETWEMVVVHLEHMYDQDAIPDRELFARFA